jgi:maleate isomerase
MTQPEWQRDGWGATIRLGVLTPAADAGPEAELNAMVPSTVTVHAARVPFAAMLPGGDMNPTIALQAVAAFAEPPGVDAAIALLAACPLQVIGFGFTSSAYVSGRDGEAQMCSRLADQARGIPVVTTCIAMVDAVRSLGCQRISLVSPPWFDTDLTTLGADYRDPGTRPRTTSRDGESGPLMGMPSGSTLLGEDRPLRASPAMSRC